MFLSKSVVTGQEKDQAKQIFTSSAASGILTNDLLRILESGKVCEIIVTGSKSVLINCRDDSNEFPILYLLNAICSAL